MYRKCTTEKTISQQRHLEECMLQLIERKDYNDITVTELCKNAGITRRIFYRLFETKDDVLYALIDHTLLQYGQFVPPRMENYSQQQEYYRHFFYFWLNNRHLLNLLAKNHMSILWITRIIDFVAREESHFFPSFPTDNPELEMDTIIFFFSGLCALVLRWQHSGFRDSVEDMVNKVQFLTQLMVDLK